MIYIQDNITVLVGFTNTLCHTGGAFSAGRGFWSPLSLPFSALDTGCNSLTCNTVIKWKLQDVQWTNHRMHTKKEKKVTGNLRTFYSKQCLEKKCVQPYVVTLQTLCPNTKKVKLSACPKQISVKTWQWLKENIHVYVYLQTLLGHQCKIVSTCTCISSNPPWPSM